MQTGGKAKEQGVSDLLSIGALLWDEISGQAFYLQAKAFKN